MFCRTFNALITCIALGGCAFAHRPTSGPFTTALDLNPAINPNTLHKTYQKGFINSYIAVTGSQVNQSLILGSFQRFSGLAREIVPEVILRDNFTGLGYFQQPSNLSLQKLCDSDQPFVAVAGAVSPLSGSKRAASAENILINCDRKKDIKIILMGFDAKAFSVSSHNKFATAIDLQALAKASQEHGKNLRWSDLNPQWPKRIIHWVFPAQLPFQAHMKELGIKMPDKFRLAANYTEIYNSGASDTDVLIYTYYSPSLNARLLGYQFRLLPVRESSSNKPIFPSPATISSQYPQKLKSQIVLALMTDKTNSCIAVNFAYFMLAFNKMLLFEQNMAPIGIRDLRESLDTINSIDMSAVSDASPFCSEVLHSTLKTHIVNNMSNQADLRP